MSPTELVKRSIYINHSGHGPDYTSLNLELWATQNSSKYCKRPMHLTLTTPGLACSLCSVETKMERCHPKTTPVDAYSFSHTLT